MALMTFLILRSLRSGRLEGRTALLQPPPDRNAGEGLTS